jgi:hypothetical protein
MPINLDLLVQGLGVLVGVFGILYPLHLQNLRRGEQREATLERIAVSIEKHIRSDKREFRRINRRLRRGSRRFRALEERLYVRNLSSASSDDEASVGPI